MSRTHLYDLPPSLKFEHLALIYRRMQPVVRYTRGPALLLFWSLVLMAAPAFAQGIITTVAGNGERGFWGNAGLAISTPLNLGPFTGGVAVDVGGNLYIADTESHRVYKVTNGQRLTVAGSDCWVCAPEDQLAGDPRAGSSGDGGPATAALINSSTGVAVDAVGNLYIVDNGNQRIRKVNTQGIIITVAGNGAAGYSGDEGPATSASLHFNRYTGNCAVDSAGNLYIPDTENNRIRKVGADGIITTVASIFLPYSVAVDASGAIYIGGENGFVQKVDSTGRSTVVASGLSVPAGVAVDRAGNFYIADSHTHRIRKVQPNGIATIIAGSGDPIFDPFEGYYFVGGYSGDGGPATNAQLNFPWGVAVDAVGSVYIADSVNNRIRKVTAEAGQSPFVGWSTTGNLNVARIDHTATLLRDGKVLVVGGIGSEHSAEFYDPAKGTWTNTASSNLGHGNHTATLLPGGKVLVVNSDGGAELFDPVTAVWSLTGHLNDANRYYHTATLLLDGKVLVAGGANTGLLFNATNSAELYDPALGTWTRTGNLNTLAALHTATLLPNGKVLVAGGSEHDDGVDSDAELYDPATGSWTVTGNLNTPRCFHAAALLTDGKVLITGGITFSGSGFAPIGSAELYDPRTGNWTRTGSLNTARQFPTATLLPDGKVLVVGGDGGNTSPLNTAEAYNPSTGTWSLTSNLNNGRYWHTATLLSNGKVLVAGGLNNNGSGFIALTIAELYSTGSNSIDDAQFFVRQHYFDFLNREPDPDGLAFWTNEITSCGAELQCIEIKRINVSAAFFLSIEFQNTGYLVERMTKAAYGDATESSTGLTVPIVKRAELTTDSASVGQGVVVNSPGWEQKLDANKQAYSLAFVQRQRFLDAYPPDLAPDQFVAKLNLNTGNVLTQSETSALVQELSMGPTAIGRANVLLKIAENSLFDSREKNRAFVLMQYFGYLRRDPDSAPDSNYSGYQFWLAKLDQFGGDFMQAEMVKAFIQSTEYRQRFAQ